jgi:hypothetical protein
MGVQKIHDFMLISDMKESAPEKSWNQQWFSLGNNSLSGLAFSVCFFTCSFISKINRKF